jgi:hypothetical protein
MNRAGGTKGWESIAKFAMEVWELGRGRGAVVEEFTMVVFSKGAEGGHNVEQSIVLFLTSACGSRPLLVELCFTLGVQ